MARLAKLMAAATLVGVTASVSACVEDEGMFYAYQLAVIDGSNVTCSEVFASEATVRAVTALDIGQTYIGGNIAYVCLQNKMKSSRNGGVETSNIVMRQYTLSLNSGAESEPRVVVGTIPADGSEGSAGLEGGRAPVRIDIFESDQLTQALTEAANKGGATQYVATVTFEGRTTGGIDVDTPEWSFPVDVLLESCYCEEPPAGATAPTCSDDIPCP
ncbi:MAG: hypothetical protein JNL21_06310 [Myxococcales bacterium]|nr:hypothetical protein [Myxococcales bacterium]